MRVLVKEVQTVQTPESLVTHMLARNGGQGERARASQSNVVLLRSALFDSEQARYSFVTARPFLTFRSSGSRCELRSTGGSQVQFGDPWRLLESLMARYELLDEVDFPFPLGGCFGYCSGDARLPGSRLHDATQARDADGHGSVRPHRGSVADAGPCRQ